MNQAIVRFAVVTSGLASALWVGRQVGEGSHGLVIFLLGAAGFLLFCAWRGLRVEAVFAGILVLGYLIGNRGFAQVSLIPGLPLFLGELGLLVGAAMIVLRMTLVHRRPPGASDGTEEEKGVLDAPGLGWLILLWVGLAGVHLLLDFPQWGMMALRDYALVYYALFFYIGLSVAGDERSRRFLLRVFMVGFVGMALVYPAFQFYGPYFVEHLTLRGIPLIYFKDDLAGIFGAAAAVLFYGMFRMRGSVLYLVPALLCLAMVPLTMSRAAMLGVVTAAFLFWRARERGWLVMVGGAAFAGVMALVLVATVSEKPLRESRLYDFYEHVVSLTDLTGTGEYRGETSRTAGDNNRFRLVWWRTVAEETLREAPLFGLGFGYNLANPFIREYYPGMIETDFTARSPHNYLVTLLGRTGVVGLLVFLVLLWEIFRQTRSLTAEARAGGQLSEPLLMQIMLWVIFTGALFGVVLEGPMGAVPFWLLLGLSQRRARAGGTTSIADAEDEQGGLASRGGKGDCGCQ